MRGRRADVANLDFDRNGLADLQLARGDLLNDQRCRLRTFELLRARLAVAGRAGRGIGNVIARRGSRRRDEQRLGAELRVERIRFVGSRGGRRVCTRRLRRTVARIDVLRLTHRIITRHGDGRCRALREFAGVRSRRGWRCVAADRAGSKARRRDSIRSRSEGIDIRRRPRRHRPLTAGRRLLCRDDGGGEGQNERRDAPSRDRTIHEVGSEKRGAV